jgi:hypothetical protein
MYNLTVDDFKNYFNRGEFNYSSLWTVNTTYNIDDIVMYKMKFYKSLVDDNINNIPTLESSNWEQILQGFYVLDSDISKAFVQAGGNFNKNLFAKDPEVGKMCFLMLTAHYIIQDYNMITGNSNVGILTSKSIGEVSASYSIPPSYLQNPLYTYLTSTPYGLKYLSYIVNRAKGAFFVVGGGTNVY